MVDKTIEKQTASGPGWLRYNGDGYGDCHILPDHTARSKVGRGRRRTWAPGTPGRCSPPSAASRIWSPGRRHRRASCSRRWIAMSSGVGLVPEQVWDAPNVAASPFGTDPTTRVDRLRQRQARRLGCTADLGCRLAGSADGRSRPRDAWLEQPRTDRRPLHHPHPAGRPRSPVTVAA